MISNSQPKHTLPGFKPLRILIVKDAESYSPLACLNKPVTMRQLRASIDGLANSGTA